MAVTQKNNGYLLAKTHLHMFVSFNIKKKTAILSMIPMPLDESVLRFKSAVSIFVGWTAWYKMYCTDFLMGTHDNWLVLNVISNSHIEKISKKFFVL